MAKNAPAVDHDVPITDPTQPNGLSNLSLLTYLSPSRVFPFSGIHFCSAVAQLLLILFALL